jgi:hypothetical protein
MNINRLDPRIYDALGVLHMQTGGHFRSGHSTAEIKSAISNFQKVSSLRPLIWMPITEPDAVAPYDYDRATAFIKSLLLNPNCSQTYMSLGGMHYRQRDLRNLQDFTEAVNWIKQSQENVGLLLASSAAGRMRSAKMCRY